MSDSDSSDSNFDRDGVLKCSTPTKAKAKYIDANVVINSDDNSSSDDSCSFDDDSSRSASPKRSTVEFNRFEHYDKSDDEDDEYRTEIAHSQEITLKIQYCCWSINYFSTCKLNKEGYINSKVYSAGAMNELEWYFRVERYKQAKDVFYGVYAHVLSHDESDAEVEFRAYIIEMRGHSYRLASSAKFPRKEGFKFLGYLRKSRIRDDDYWYYRMIPDDTLTLSFRIHVQFKKPKNKLVNDFKALWKNKKFTDFTLVVKGQEFPVHKTILAARSPVLAEILEKKSDTKLEIDDFEPEMVEELLRYMYTGRIKKLVKFLKQFSTAADRYKLTDLKCICDKAITSYT